MMATFLYFNSIKVRLELSCSLILFIVASFQFHKGTIRTFAENRANAALTYFNSIKVRLELLVFFVGIFFHFNFNSIKVRLELSCSETQHP